MNPELNNGVTPNSFLDNIPPKHSVHNPIPEVVFADSRSSWGNTASDNTPTQITFNEDTGKSATRLFEKLLEGSSHSREELSESGISTVHITATTTQKEFDKIVTNLLRDSVKKLSTPMCHVIEDSSGKLALESLLQDPSVSISKKEEALNKVFVPKLNEVLSQIDSEASKLKGVSDEDSLEIEIVTEMSKGHGSQFEWVSGNSKEWVQSEMIRKLEEGYKFAFKYSDHSICLKKPTFSYEVAYEEAKEAITKRNSSKSTSYKESLVQLIKRHEELKRSYNHYKSMIVTIDSLLTLPKHIKELVK